MIGLRSVRRVFAYGAPTDMRKSFDTLAAIAREQMKHDVLRGDVFVFVGRDRRRAKLLWWDGTGLCVLAKRLSKGQFVAPRVGAGAGSSEVPTSEIDCDTTVPERCFFAGRPQRRRRARAPCPSRQREPGFRRDVPLASQ